MTTHYETVAKVTTVQHVLAATCDGCGTELPDLFNHKTREFELEFTKGESWHDDNSGDGWRVDDLCDNCVGILKQLLQDNNFNVVEFDW